MKSFGLTETKLFHFHRIFKNGGGGGFESLSKQYEKDSNRLQKSPLA